MTLEEFIEDQFIRALIMGSSIDAAAFTESGIPTADACAEAARILREAINRALCFEDMQLQIAKRNIGALLDK